MSTKNCVIDRWMRLPSGHALLVGWTISEDAKGASDLFSTPGPIGPVFQ